MGIEFGVRLGEEGAATIGRQARKLTAFGRKAACVYRETMELLRLKAWEDALKVSKPPAKGVITDPTAIKPGS